MFPCPPTYFVTRASSNRGNHVSLESEKPEITRLVANLLQLVYTIKETDVT